MKYFYNVSTSNIKIVFFSNNNVFIKEYNISSPDNLSEIKINKSFLNDIESYGVFYIFHETNEKVKSIIRNSCYTGYSWKKIYLQWYMAILSQHKKNLKIKI